MQPPKHQRTVLVVGGFPYDTERDVICEKLREIFGHELGVKDLWTLGKVGSVGEGQFPHKRPCVDFPQEAQGQEVLIRSKAAVAHLGSPKRGSPHLEGSIFGDQGPTQSGGGEGYPDQWCRDGHRWRLGARPRVVHMIENGGESHHYLQTCKRLLFRTGVHRRNDSGLGRWIEAMDEVNHRK